jgi:hypothetical protein
LSGVQIAERRGRYGANVLPTPRRTSLALRFLRQFTDMFAVLLIAALSRQLDENERADAVRMRWAADALRRAGDRGRAPMGGGT